MTVSIRTKLISFSILGLCVSGAVGLVARAGIESLVSSLHEVEVSGQAIRNHMETDMMHDALRGDVFEALRAQSPEEHGAAIESVKEHTGTIREMFEENKHLPLNEAGEFAGHVLRFLDDDGEPVDAGHLRRRGVEALHVDFASRKNDGDAVQKPDLVFGVGGDGVFLFHSCQLSVVSYQYWLLRWVRNFGV